MEDLFREFISNLGEIQEDDESNINGDNFEISRFTIDASKLNPDCIQDDKIVGNINTDINNDIIDISHLFVDNTVENYIDVILYIDEKCKLRNLYISPEKFIAFYKNDPYKFSARISQTVIVTNLNACIGEIEYEILQMLNFKLSNYPLEFKNKEKYLLTDKITEEEYFNIISKYSNDKSFPLILYCPYPIEYTLDCWKDNIIDTLPNIKDDSSLQDLAHDLFTNNGMINCDDEYLKKVVQWFIDNDKTKLLLSCHTSNYYDMFMNEQFIKDNIDYINECVNSADLINLFKYSPYDIFSILNKDGYCFTVDMIIDYYANGGDCHLWKIKHVHTKTLKKILNQCNNFPIEDLSLNSLIEICKEIRYPKKKNPNTSKDEDIPELENVI